jgi:hypothetical protein
MGTAAVVGVLLATILVITVVTLVWVARRRERPRRTGYFALSGTKRSRKWLAGGYGGAGGAGDGYSGCAGISGCGRGGSS